MKKAATRICNTGKKRKSPSPPVNLQQQPEKRGRPSKVGLLARVSVPEMMNLSGELKARRLHYKNNSKEYLSRYAEDRYCDSLEDFKLFTYLSERRTKLLAKVREINDELDHINNIEDIALDKLKTNQINTSNYDTNN